MSHATNTEPRVLEPEDRILQVFDDELGSIQIRLVGDEPPQWFAKSTNEAGESRHDVPLWLGERKKFDLARKAKAPTTTEGDPR